MIATAHFGGPTFMSCKVANDSDGDIYIADLETAGVDHCFKGERDTGITGKCLVLVTPDAERSMNTFRWYQRNPIHRAAGCRGDCRV